VQAATDASKLFLGGVTTCTYSGHDYFLLSSSDCGEPVFMIMVVIGQVGHPKPLALDPY
jgi:hypothetical protein